MDRLREVEQENVDLVVQQHIQRLGLRVRFARNSQVGMLVDELPKPGTRHRMSIPY